MSKNTNENTKVEQKEAPVNQEPENNNVPAAVERKQNWIDRGYAKYCERRDAKAKKNAEKQPRRKLTKTEKAVIGGVGLAVLGGVAKSVLTSVANKADYELQEGDVQVDDIVDEGPVTESETTDTNVDSET